jgi:pimeloyl-ACP methyl ester carboxylesterase
MTELKHRFVETNGISMHVAEQGRGRLVVLCHGFPELWYSWRHQLTALADAGFHAVAPDQRGYGQTDRPIPIHSYNIFQLTGDMVGLVQAMGEEEAVVIGHDWGSVVASHCALLRPDVFTAVGLMSVPYLMRRWGGVPPTELMKRLEGGDQDMVFYQRYFQEPGVAESELEADVGSFMMRLMYALSGDAPESQRWRHIFKKSGKMHGSLPESAPLPSWLRDEDIEYFIHEFTRTGFTGGLNWYRNIDYNWDQTPFLSNARIPQPAIMIYGDADPSLSFFAGVFKHAEFTMPNLKNKVLMPGTGHWIQQERPDEINKLLIDFLKEL